MFKTSKIGQEIKSQDEETRGKITLPTTEEPVKSTIDCQQWIRFHKKRLLVAALMTGWFTLKRRFLEENIGLANFKFSTAAIF